MENKKIDDGLMSLEAKVLSRVVVLKQSAQQNKLKQKYLNRLIKEALKTGKGQRLRKIIDLIIKRSST